MNPCEYRKKVTNSIRESARKFLAIKEREKMKSMLAKDDHTNSSSISPSQGDDGMKSSKHNDEIIPSMLQYDSNERVTNYTKNKQFNMTILCKNENESRILSSQSTRIQQTSNDPLNYLHDREENFGELISSIENMISSISSCLERTEPQPQHMKQVAARASILNTSKIDSTDLLKDKKAGSPDICENVTREFFSMSTQSIVGSSNIRGSSNVTIANNISSRDISITENIFSSPIIVREYQDRNDTWIGDSNDDSFLTYIDETLGKINENDITMHQKLRGNFFREDSPQSE
jgi:hypothetical protein